MFGGSFRRAKTGELIKAVEYNRLLDELERLGRLTLSGNFSGVFGPMGDLIQAPDESGFWASIVSGAQPYAWVELIPNGVSTMYTASRSGTPTSLPAYEVNGNTDVPPGSVVWMTNGSNADYRFQRGPCT